MSKTSKSIQMLEVLYSRDVVGINELGSILETNPRNIPEYKKELEDAGYIIDTVRGKYGGYCLVKKYLFPAVKLTGSEKAGLKAGYEYLRSRDDFMEDDAHNRAMAKVAAAIDLNERTEPPLVVKKTNLSMSQRDLSNRYVSIGRSIISKYKIKMDYEALKGDMLGTIIHPYKLFMYDDAWYVLAFCEDRKDIRYFKLNRIRSFEILSEKFRVALYYNERDYLDEYGMKKDGEWYPIKLKLLGQYAYLVKEYIYGKDQEVISVDDTESILKVTMQNKERVVNFVLGFGKNCVVLEPKWLKDEVIEKCKNILSNY